MIPILYEKTETAFTSNGICRLPDMISGTVTEERNGVFIAEFEYPVDGENYAEIQIGRIIFCSCSHSDKQPFEIYESSKPINGRVLFTARHLTYRGNFIPIEPFELSNTTPQAVMNAMRDSHVIGSPTITCPFTFESNETSLNNYKQTEPAVLRSRLGGTEGSILDVWGGEYEWGYDFINQCPKVTLWEHRGTNRGVQIKYGKNLTDLQQEESIENMVTGIILFYKNEETCLYSNIAYSSAGGQYTTYHRIGIVDVSDKYGEVIPTQQQLNSAATAYVTSHNIGVPKVNLNVSFVNLADTEEYKNIAVLETVKLCDTVNVEFEKLGVSATAKVIRTVWNFLLDRYDSIELGEGRTNISSQMIEQDDTIKEIKNNIPQLVDMQAAIERATKLITGQTGGYVVIEQDPDNNNYPKRILVMDTDNVQTAQKVWQFNLSGIGYSKNGINGTYTSAFVVDANNNGYLNTQMIAANSIEGEKIKANDIEVGHFTAATQELLAQDEQYIYISKNATTAISGDTTWVTDATGNQNTWTTRRPEYNASYPYCFVAKQKKDSLGTVTCTTPVIDNTTTTIDGGHIKTGIISDPNNRNSINMLTGAFTLANGAFNYTAGNDYVSLTNNLSLRLNDIPLAGIKNVYNSESSYTGISWGTELANKGITAEFRVMKMPYLVLIEGVFTVPKTKIFNINNDAKLVQIYDIAPQNDNVYFEFVATRTTPRTIDQKRLAYRAVRGAGAADTSNYLQIDVQENIGSSTSENDWTYSFNLVYARKMST